MTVRCALYLRQSVDHAEGIDRQEARTRGLADQRGYSITRVYRDNAQSASKARGVNSAWGQMLRDLEAGAFTHIIAVNLDRLTRSQRDLLTLIDAGAKVMTVDGEVDLSTPDGEFQATMSTGFSRMEVRRKSERQKRANEYRVSKGKPVPGRRRYGYQQDNMTPVPEEAAVVQFIFQRFVEDRSVRAIATALNAEGRYPTTGTDRWTTRRVRDTIMNRSYIGEVRHLGTWTPSEYVVPLVDADLFKRANDILADPTRKTSPGAEVRHLLSGLVHCGVCGARFTYMRDYRCRANASHPVIKKAILEPLVLNQVVGALLMGPGTILGAIGDQGHSVADLDAALTEIRTRREGIMLLVREGLSTPQAERPTLSRLVEEEKRLAARRDSILQTSVAAEVLSDLKSSIFDGHTADFAKAADAARAIAERVQALPLHRHRELVSLLLDIEVHSGRSTDRVHVKHRVVTSLN
ncbi:hypothetical protein DEJ04_10860 [Curtobacterium sp. MCLR17_044]|nr:hypothetical protein DEJ04_10860 [Curtobacterium sp. MCLR17_044]